MILELTDPTRGTSEPGRCWTQTNVTEASPEVMSPLCWSVWILCPQISTRRAFYDFGLVPRSHLAAPTDPNQLCTACFYGRQAINIDAMREIFAMAPGASADDLERDIFGYVREDAPPVRETRRRYPFVAARVPYVVVRQRRRLVPMHEEQLAWWRAEVLGERITLSPRELLQDSMRRFDAAMTLHLYSRGNLLPAAQGPLTAMATKVGGPDLPTRLLGGQGESAETEIADDLWQISRGRLTVDEFVRRHGFHGPSEGSPIAKSWRDDPSPIESLAKAYATRPDEDAPRVREQRAFERHTEAAAELLAGLRGPQRARARILLRVMRNQVRYLGIGKSSFLMGLDGARAATRRIGAELVERGVTTDPEDAFYLTAQEHLGPVPENFAEVVAFRRARRAEYEAMELPVTWYGMPEAVVRTESSERVDVLSGTPGSGGVVEGRVRVVHDPLDADALEPGEIMVCRLTDPSWAALFPLAEAVVIDIGGAASHGAVVSRELGIPCVIGTGNGTRVLRTGDLVRVDGGRGHVEVLERAQS